MICLALQQFEWAAGYCFIIKLQLEMNILQQLNRGLAVNDYILIKQNKTKTERKMNLINEILM